jgi:hypothetical protein
MMVLMVGGPYGDQPREVVMPIFALTELPPFICVGAAEPYQHFLLQHDTRLYVHSGPCGHFYHAGSYPHQHDD